MMGLEVTMRRLALWILIAGCSNKDDGSTTDSPPDPTDETGTTLPGELTVEAFDAKPLAYMASLVRVSWTQSHPAPAHVEYRFDTDEWLSTPPIDGVAGENKLVVAGLPFETEAEWRVVVDGQRFDPGLPLVTGELPSGVPVGRVQWADPERWLPDGRFYLGSVNEQPGGWTGGWYWTVIFDRQGRPVWASRAPDQHWTLFAQVSVTGDHLLWDEATYWSDWDDGDGSVVHRTYLDKEIEVIATPGLHHAFVELPDGTLVWGSQAHGGGEALVEKAPGQADDTILWTCQDDWPGSGNCESNGLFYVEQTDSFLYSFYTNSSLVEVDRATGASVWWAGTVAGGYDFEPAWSQFWWQHGISYTDGGTLLLSTEVSVAPDGHPETWAREYTVDHQAGTLTRLWDYPSGVHAATNGDTWRLSNGNTLHTIGSGSEIKEVAPDGQVVWHVDFGSSQLLGRGELIDDLYALLKPPDEAD